jgi:DNA-directed RNA polymerase subunit omega
MLLYPSVDALNEEVPNRYLLVNVVARKARELAEDAERIGEPLPEKPVTMAIHEVAAGKVTVDPQDLYNALNADECAVNAESAEDEQVPPVDIFADATVGEAAAEEQE